MAEDAATAAQRECWDRRHAEAREIGAPAEVLLRNVHLLPARGKALDLACGRGASALWLAAHTALTVEAWDFSPVAVARLTGAAAVRGLRIGAAVRDVVARPPAPDTCDVLLVTHFLERDLDGSLRVNQFQCRIIGFEFREGTARQLTRQSWSRIGVWLAQTNQLHGVVQATGYSVWTKVAR